MLPSTESPITGTTDTDTCHPLTESPITATTEMKQLVQFCKTNLAFEAVDEDAVEYIPIRQICSLLYEHFLHARRNGQPVLGEILLAKREIERECARLITDNLPAPGHMVWSVAQIVRKYGQWQDDDLALLDNIIRRTETLFQTEADKARAKFIRLSDPNSDDPLARLYRLHPLEEKELVYTNELVFSGIFNQ